MRDYNATIQKVVEYSVLYLLDVSDDEKSRKRRNQKVRDRMKKEKIEKKKRERMKHATRQKFAGYFTFPRWLVFP